jgi:signal transduction histidine kinase
MMAASESAPVPPVPWTRIDKFVNQLTHDLRNGLNAIELQLTLIGEIASDAEVTAEVKVLRGTLLDMTRQLQAVKTLTGPVSPHLLNYPAADFFEDLRIRFSRAHPEAAERVQWKIDAGAGSIGVDPELSLAALLELLDNALHFSDPNAAIDFLADAEGDGGITVTLREPQQQPPAVSPGDWGLTPLSTTRRKGYGLGLFRARRIIEAQGGTLAAEYSEVDHVLTTVITLPAAG